MINDAFIKFLENKQSNSNCAHIPIKLQKTIMNLCVQSNKLLKKKTIIVDQCIFSSKNVHHNSSLNFY